MEFFDALSEIFVERRRIVEYCREFGRPPLGPDPMIASVIARSVEPPSRGKTMLLIRDLVKIYPGPVTALAGIDLQVPNGMFGLLGPNGAGKTTLMRILAGCSSQAPATASLDGEPILDSPERIWGRLGYLPQDFGFFPTSPARRCFNICCVSRA